MIRVAYADDDLDKRETSLLIGFAKMIGVTQEQLNKIKGEVLASLKNEGKICPSCGTTIDSDSKFCSKCGLNLVEQATEVQIEFEIPKTGLAIEFAESTAASFPQALEEAKNSDEFQNCLKNKKNWYLATYKSGEIKDALPLAEALSGIRNRRVYINGHEKTWDEVFGFSWCSRQRSMAYVPVEYCFGKDENRINPWGCKQARMDWAQWSNWFQYGQWEKAGFLGSKFQWKFDKKRILHELETNLHKFRFCPHLQLTLGKSIIKHLPETVTPDDDPNWDYNEQYQQAPGAIKVVKKEKSEWGTYTDEFWSDGVRPKGLKVLKEVMSKAFKEVGYKETTVSNLLK